MKKRRSRIIRISAANIPPEDSCLHIGTHSFHSFISMITWMVITISTKQFVGYSGAGGLDLQMIMDWKLLMLYILSSLKSSQYAIGLNCLVINQETHSPCCMPSTCSHPKSILLWLKKFSVQRDLHVESRLRLQVVQDCQTLAVKQLEPTCISVW